LEGIVKGDANKIVVGTKYAEDVKAQDRKRGISKCASAGSYI
jgi:hypothetical protein